MAKPEINSLITTDTREYLWANAYLLAFKVALSEWSGEEGAPTSVEIARAAANTALAEYDKAVPCTHDESTARGGGIHNGFHRAE